jgi:SAM-dependent methyltransferase
MKVKTYNDLTHNSRFFLRRFSHDTRYRLAIAQIPELYNMRVLDLFCGGAEVLLRIRDEFRDYCPKLFGFEPLEFHYQSALDNMRSNGVQEDIVVYRDEQDLYRQAPYDVILCLEAFEHFDKVQNDQVLTMIESLLAPGGTLIMSVPVEVGAVSLVKNTLRRVAGSRKPGDSFRNVFLSTAYLTKYIDTGEANSIRNGHIGFDYRMIEKLLSGSQLEVTEKVFSPFSRLNGAFNSQVFYIARPKAYLTQPECCRDQPEES